MILPSARAMAGGGLAPPAWAAIGCSRRACGGSGRAGSPGFALVAGRGALGADRDRASPAA